MTIIDIFDKPQFEDALPTHRATGEPLWVCLGLKSPKPINARQGIKT